jgi:hypothetical protein
MIERIQRDQFWCQKVQSMKTLRSKWPELALKLCPVNLATGGSFGVSSKLIPTSRKGSGANKFNREDISDGKNY